MKSRAMVQTADRTLEMRELDVPRTDADGALLRLEACGLCGSDVEQFRGHFVQKGIISYPVVPGHEPVGVIEDIGASAQARWGVAPGDRVAVVPFLSCGRCRVCLGGTHHLCASASFGGAPRAAYGSIPADFDHGLWGGYSDFMVLHPRTLLCRVPDSVPAEYATLYQALASGLRWAVHVPKTSFGETVLVLGAGQRGLAALVALKACGAGTVIVTGIARDMYKLELARRLGADHTIVADQEDVVERVMEVTGGRGVDVALDAAPVSSKAVIDAIDCVRVGGRVVLAGLKGADITTVVDTDKIVLREISVLGVSAQPLESYRAGMELLASRVAELAPLHTHRYPLEEATRALAVLAGEDESQQPVSITIGPLTEPWAASPSASGHEQDATT